MRNENVFEVLSTPETKKKQPESKNHYPGIAMRKLT